ncbi:MAG: ATP-binding protein [Muribaculaceae bacterium]
MERKVYQKLLDWKKNPGRKPLILSGARQVGKTWLMKEFGKREYKKVLYANFDLDERLCGIFEQDYDVQRILLALQALIGVVPTPGDTLIILDEIQEVNRGLGALKYFCENAPEYHVMVAGSLLGITLHPGTSFPVGKVDMIDVHPLDFEEFLWATGNKELSKLLHNPDWKLMSVFKTKYVELLRRYYYVGGMPEVVQAFANNYDLKEVRTLQNTIIDAYRNDISKHAPAGVVQRIQMVMNSIPSQLAKENKKFIYGAVKKGGRANDFEFAIQWLMDCGIVTKVSRIRKASVPLKFYEDLSAFKLFFLDLGLLAAMSEAPADLMLASNSIFEEFKGMFTEQYVLQQMVAREDLFIYYWSSERNDAELDFVVQKGSKIIPIEVKAEENVKAKSLNVFVASNPGLHGVRLSMSDYREQDWMTNIPLFCLLYSL